jgi:hypothetical protein
MGRIVHVWNVYTKTHVFTLRFKHIHAHHAHEYMTSGKFTHIHTHTLTHTHTHSHTHTHTHTHTLTHTLTAGAGQIVEKVAHHSDCVTVSLPLPVVDGFDEVRQLLLDGLVFLTHGL